VERRDQEIARNHGIFFYFDKAGAHTLEGVDGCQRIETRRGRLAIEPAFWPTAQGSPIVFDHVAVEHEMLRADRFRLERPGRDLLPFIRRQAATDIPCPNVCFAGAKGNWVFQASLAPEALPQAQERSLLRLKFKVRSGVLAVRIYDEKDQALNSLRFDASREPYDIVIPVAASGQLSPHFPAHFSSYADLATPDFDLSAATLYPMSAPDSLKGTP
jgi:hypothetical protein